MSQFVNIPAVLNEKGIEISKPVIRDFAGIISGLVTIDANNDGKVDFGEGVSFGSLLFQSVLKHYSSISEFIAEMKNTDSAERKELIAVFADGFDLPNDEVEILIEDTVIYLEDTASKGIELAKRYRDLGKQAA